MKNAELIVHNSWRSPGISVEYFMGQRSEENDGVICPNHGSATFDCIVHNSGDVSKCRTNIQRVRGKGLTSHVDLLVCRDLNRLYVIETPRWKSEVYSEPLFSGFGPWNGNDFKRDLFAPDSKTFVANDPTLCGYWIVPAENSGYARSGGSQNYSLASSTNKFTDVTFDGCLPCQNVS